MPTADPDSLVLSGDPHAIADSARSWLSSGDRYARQAIEVRRCRVPEFGGDEGARFNVLVERYASDLAATGAAWRAGGRALGRYADRLAECQRALDGVALQVRDATACDGPVSIAPGVVTARSQARLSDDVRHLHLRAVAVLAEHDEAVRQCRAGVDSARALLPVCGSPGAAPPAGPGLTPTRWRRPATSIAGLPGVAAGLRAASGQSALAAAIPHVTGWGDFFDELGSLLGVAGLALVVLGPGGGGGAGLALAGGAGVAAAAPPVAVTGAAVAGAVAGGVALAVLIASIVKGESPGEVVSDALSGNKIAGKPEINLHDLAELNRSKIPPDVLKEVDDAIARAKIGKKRFPGHDGKPWKNDDHALPLEPPDYYHEWTAAGNGEPRGDFRVIIGGRERDPDVIYFWDHSDNPPVYIGPGHP